MVVFRDQDQVIGRSTHGKGRQFVGDLGFEESPEPPVFGIVAGMQCDDGPKITGLELLDDPDFGTHRFAISRR